MRTGLHLPRPNKSGPQFLPPTLPGREAEIVGTSRRIANGHREIDLMMPVESRTNIGQYDGKTRRFVHCLLHVGGPPACGPRFIYERYQEGETMDWTYPAGAGEEGIYEIGRRLAERLGRFPEATAFVHDPREMLRVTRRVEANAKTGNLLSGFQTSKKFDVEAARYRQLVAANTHVTVYGTGRPVVDIPGVDYRQLRPHTRRLENQWFLVSDAPLPIAFVSWELGDPGTFGVGGAAAEGKLFVGFISEDPDVVGELIRALTSVSGLGERELEGYRARREESKALGAPTEAAPVAALSDEPVSRLDHVDPMAESVIAAVAALAPPATGAAEGAVVVPVGRGDSDAALHLAIAVAKAEGRSLVLVERSGEGLFSSPYGDLRGDDDLRPRKDELFGARLARREGRGATASAIDAASFLGVRAGGWFPTAAGGDGLRAALKRFNGALLVLPAETRQPSIGERIRGMTIEKLQRLGVPVLVAD
ncbi:MAG: DICT sensory domain-containing protein [Dehalococcoidia bacterium]